MEKGISCQMLHFTEQELNIITQALWNRVAVLTTIIEDDRDEGLTELAYKEKDLAVDLGRQLRRRNVDAEA